MSWRNLIGTFVLGAFVAAGSPAAAEQATLTGTIGDAMCGAKHMMAGNPTGCTEGCVKKGSDYALIVDGKAYTLKAGTDTLKAELAKLAGKSARITGDRNGETIQVSSVQAAK